jgi:hypothetical protein
MTQSGEILYSILIEYDITVKVVRLIKVCLNKTCSKICIVKYVRCISYSEWSETRRCSVPIVFQVWFKICHQEGMKLNVTHQLPVHADSVDISGENINTIKIP